MIASEIELPKRIPCLDGWRAISIVLVLIAHSRRVPGFPEKAESLVRWLPNGSFGVQVFFIISGFLITVLLLREVDRTGTISLRKFYQRRAFRILPAYLVFLLVLLSLQLTTSFGFPNSSWLALVTYTVNYFETPWTGAHIWSLSVEEQFYLIWPIIFLFALRRNSKPSFLVVLLLVPILLSPIARIVDYRFGELFLVGGHSFIKFADALAVGCLFAILMVRFPERISKWFIRMPVLLTVFGVTLISLEIFLTRTFLFGFFTVPFGYSIRSFAICLLVGVTLHHYEHFAFRWLNWQPIVTLGLWSYSIYIWQQLFCTPYDVFGLSGSSWYLNFPFWLVPTLVVASLSYYIVELPFLRLKERLPR